MEKKRLKKSIMLSLRCCRRAKRMILLGAEKKKKNSAMIRVRKMTLKKMRRVKAKRK
jgi:hypothetical protein